MPSLASPCTFCNRRASVTYRYFAGWEFLLCGGHAQEILGDLPVEMFRSLERAA